MDYRCRKPHRRPENQTQTAAAGPTLQKTEFRGFLEHGAKREARGIAKDLVARGEMIHSDPHRQQVSQVGPRQEVRRPHPPRNSKHGVGRLLMLVHMDPTNLSDQDRVQNQGPGHPAAMVFPVHQVTAPAL